MSAPHWGTIRRWSSILSPPVDTCRYPVGSIGSTGSTGGLEDEDERMLYREPMRALAAAAEGTVAVV
ncbi:MAG: hypothetical protein ACOYD3_01900 [Kiritimatiellia bacterium]